MILYVLDKNFRSKITLESLVSAVWTDRYFGEGDFEIDMIVDADKVSSIEMEDYLYLKGSEHLMIIETVEVSTDFEEGDRLHLSGRSLESILRRRIVWDKSRLIGDFQDNILRLISANIINPSNSSRMIPKFTYKKSTDPRILALEINAELFGENLYEVIYDQCLEKNVGFKVILNDAGMMEFSLYYGTDRSYMQNANPWIVFSPQFDNLSHSNYIESRNNIMTAVLVYAEDHVQNDEGTEGGEGDGSDTGENTDTVVEIFNEVISPVYPYQGLYRRETFVEASATKEKIDKDEWGNAADYVNANDYKQYVLMYYDRKAHEEAIAKYAGKWYVGPDGTRYSDWSAFTDRSNFETWGWEWKPGGYEAYNAAVAAEQTRIDNEYNAAVNNSEAVFANALNQKGLDELSKYSIGQSFDGEIQNFVQYILNRDFFIGDIVQVQNKYYMQSTCRITEVAYMQDASGEYAYPTFSNI